MAKKVHKRVGGGAGGPSEGSGGAAGSGTRRGGEGVGQGAAEREWWRQHLWEVQPVRDVLVVAGVVGLVYLGKALSIVTVPLLLALALSYLFEPVVGWLTRVGGFRRRSAVAGIIVAVVAVVAVPVTLGVGFAAAQGASTVDRIARGVTAVRASVQAPEDETLRRRVESLGPPWPSVREYLVQGGGVGGEEPSATHQLVNLVLGWVQANSSALASKLYGTGRDAVGVALSTLTGVGKALFMAFLTGFFFFFLSTGYPGVLAFGRRLIPERHSERVLDLLVKFDRVIAGFVRGRITIAAIQSVVFTAAFWVIGVPVPLVIGPVVAVLSIVPYVAMVGIPIAVVGLWVDPGGPLPSGLTGSWVWIVAAPVGVYFAGQALDDYVWTPAIQGKATDMDTPTILFASIAGGALLGVYGLLLAIPVAACLKILIREVFWPRFKAWSEGREKDFLPLGRG